MMRKSYNSEFTARWREFNIDDFIASLKLKIKLRVMLPNRGLYDLQ